MKGNLKPDDHDKTNKQTNRKQNKTKQHQQKGNSLSDCRLSADWTSDGSIGFNALRGKVFGYGAREG